MDTPCDSRESIHDCTPDVLRSEIAQLEYQRWQAIFERAFVVLIQEWDDVLDERRYALLQATLGQGN